MITKINDNWYLLTFESDDGKFACFGFNEEAVKGKFAKWHRKVCMGHQLIRRPVELYNDFY